MSNVDKSLSEMFGVEPIWNPEDSAFPLAKPEEATPQVPDVIKEKEQESDEEKIESDIEFSRQKLLSLLNKGEDAFEYLLHLAKTEERVNAFEVLNSMLANMTDMSMKIIDIQEKKKKLMSSTKKDDSNTPVNNTTTNNIIFTGTTSDLQEMIKKQLKDDSDIIEGE